MFSFLWNLVMVHLECCGVSSHQDFQDTQLWGQERDNLQVSVRSAQVIKGGLQSIDCRGSWLAGWLQTNSLDSFYLSIFN